jgi:esterase/lipase superfamily enzyme
MEIEHQGRGSKWHWEGKRVLFHEVRMYHMNRIWQAFTARWILVALVIVALSACTSRSGPEVLQPMGGVSGSKIVTIFVATLRTPEAGTGAAFNSGQSQTLRYARYAISIPSTHRPAAIEWPSGSPNPATDFVTVEAAHLSEAEFRAGVAGTDCHGRLSRLYVHGFNNSFQETVYRLAQVAADAHDNQVAVLFAWPSKANPLGYDADRAAAAASTDGLAKTIEILVERPCARLTLLAHSMGGWLTMETLAKMGRERRRAVLDRLSNVVLAAPDIDANDMVRQLEIIGRFPRLLTVLVSNDDSALNLARLISGRPRVGSDDVRDPRVRAAAKRFGARVVDISELEASDGFKHGRFAAMAAFYLKFHEQLENPSGPHYAGPGVFMFKASTSTFEPVER